MKVDPSTPGGVAAIIGYFALKITLVITGAVMTYLGSDWWALLILFALMF
jgi:hypothetical protein